MRLLIVEDEEIVARRLERLLMKVLADRAPTILRATALGPALAEISGAPIDLLFLDLNLNGRNGFDLLAEAASRRFQTIVVSAHEEQAIAAFEVGVTDFVPKPFTEARLQRALDRVFERDAPRRETLRYLAVRRAGEVRPIPIEEVVFLQGAGDYAEIRCRDGSSHLHDKSLTTLEHLLPRTFVRIHRSFVANLRFVEVLRSEPGSRYSLCLSTGDELPVSRTRVGLLRSHLI